MQKCNLRLQNKVSLVDRHLNLKMLYITIEHFRLNKSVFKRRIL